MNLIQVDERDQTRKLLGQRLKLLRVYKNLSQKEFASKLGYTQAFLSDVEAGKKILPTDVLIKVVKLFDIDLSFFDPRKPIVFPTQEMCTITTKE
jgi:transcriptional regulator with XRE-family HTH domain